VTAERAISGLRALSLESQADETRAAEKSSDTDEPTADEPTNEPRQDRPTSQLHGILFDSRGEARIVDDLDTLTSLTPSDEQLLWIDVEDAPEQWVERLVERLPLPQGLVQKWTAKDLTPALHNCGESFWLRVVAVDDIKLAQFSGSALSIVAGRNVVLTLHKKPIAFIHELRARESGETELGRLSAASFTASLLDWLLSTYFDAVAQFEVVMEKLELTILSQRPRNCLDELRVLRQAASRLRQMLAPHRAVFAGLARPDFRPQEDDAVNSHFLALDARFERATDNVDSARDLVVGSFDLFSSRTALVINDSMRVLTVATVVLGVMGLLLAFFGTSGLEHCSSLDPRSRTQSIVLNRAEFKANPLTLHEHLRNAGTEYERQIHRAARAFTATLWPQSPPRKAGQATLMVSHDFFWRIG